MKPAFSTVLHIVAIANARLCGMGWDHTMAGIVEQQFRQQMIGLAAYEGAMGPLGKCLLPDRIKQRAIHDRRLLEAAIPTGGQRLCRPTGRLRSLLASLL